MAAAVKGVGVVWSTGGITYTGGIVGGGATGHRAAPQALEIVRSSDKAEIKDNGGILRAQVFSAFRKTLRLTIVPYGLTLLAASQSADAHMVDVVAGGTTSIVGRSVAVVDDAGAIADGTYNCTNVRQGRTVDGVATIDIDLEAGDEGNDITTLVT